MKKLLILLIILAGCQHRPVHVTMTSRAFNDPWNPVFVGTVPNDGTGYTLRNAMIQLNTTDAATLDSLKAHPDTTQVDATIQNYHDTLLNNAELLSDYALNKADSNGYNGDFITRPYLESRLGGGGGATGKFYTLSGRVDDLGFPDAGDSVLVHTNFVGKHITVFREGAFQQQHTDNTVQDGYKFNNATGTITFRPVLAASEQLEIWSTNTIQWEALVAEGGGGEGENSLLTGLKAWWQLDEVSGMIVNDVLDTYNATSTGVLNVAGKFGVAESFTAGSSMVANMGYDVGDVGTSDWSFGAWFYASTSGTTIGIMGTWGDYPYYYVMVNSTNKVRCVLNFANTNLTFDSDATVSTSTWYHVVINCDRSGNATMYLNGVAQADVEDISAHVAVSMTKTGSTNRFAVGAIGDAIVGYDFTGRIDCPFIYPRILTQNEINDLQVMTYPFTQLLWLIFLLIPNYKRKFNIAA